MPALVCKEIPVRFPIYFHLTEPDNLPCIKGQVFRVLMVSALLSFRSLQAPPCLVSDLTSPTGCAS